MPVSPPDPRRPPVGVLALQGDFAAHAAMARAAGAEPREVRLPAELDGLAGLILPGGETSALLRHFDRLGFAPALREFAARGGALFGTCAGAILLAREVTSPRQPSLQLLDIRVERNAYGRQRESFEADLAVPSLPGGTVRAVFIRAPRIRECGPGVQVLARVREEAVLVREGRVLAATFHPEIARDPRLHRMFLDMLAAPAPDAR